MAKSRLKNKSESYTKVGRIKMSIARAAKLKCANIYVSKNQMKHIDKEHGFELSKLGISAEAFVEFICSSFNQIRVGDSNSYLLVVFDKKMPSVAAISLNYSLKNEFWEIKTAQPRRCKTIEKKTLLWEAAKHTSNGNGNRPN